MNGLSARRAFIMFVLAMIAGYIGRTYDIISALAISIVIIITDNPYAILNDGFLLSVFAIFGIAVVYNTIRKFFRYIWNCSSIQHYKKISENKE